MWGVKGGKLKGIAQAMEEFKPNSNKGQDQAFLWEWIWGKVKDGELAVCVHDPFFQKSPFPDGAKRGEENGGVWFVGQCFDADDNYNSQDDVDLLQGH
jgi:hypothetical protein